MVDGTRDGDHEIAWAVVGAIVLPDGVAADRADRLGAASDGSTQRVIAEDRFEEALTRDVARVVIRHGELFEDHAALVLEVHRVEHRRCEHVGEHTHRHVEVAIAHLREVAGVLLGGERVVLASHRIEGHRDVERAAGFRALEEQVLEEVRRAVGHGLLIT